MGNVLSLASNIWSFSLNWSGGKTISWDETASVAKSLFFASFSSAVASGYVVTSRKSCCSLWPLCNTAQVVYKPYSYHNYIFCCRCSKRTDSWTSANIVWRRSNLPERPWWAALFPPAAASVSSSIIPACCLSVSQTQNWCDFIFSRAIANLSCSLDTQVLLSYLSISETPRLRVFTFYNPD